jgi:hypothetical protein
VISAIQPGGAVAAKVNATGRQFQFAVTDAALLRSLKVGQGIYANFGASQVSIDGKTPCCKITSMAPDPAKPTGSTAAAAPVASTSAIAPGQGTGWQLKHVEADTGGRHVSADVWRMSGGAGVQASSLPAAYRDALAQRVKTLPADSLLLVTKAAVDRWLQAHPPGTPQSLVSDALNSCNEKPVSSSVGLNFNQPIDLPYTLNNTSLGGGVSASGRVDVNFPFHGTFNVELQGYYEPCLFVTRPTAMRAAGTMGFGASITVDITKVNFQKDIPIPSQPLTFPLLHGAIAIGDVPVEAGIDLFVQGGVAIKAQADVDIRFFASGNADGPFDVSCDGKKCGGTMGLVPTFTTSNQFGLNGNGVHASVQPYVFGGLQLEVEGGSLLRAQIGPRPNLNGDFWAFTGQACSRPGTMLAKAETVNALTVDLDAGIDLRYHLKSPVAEKSEILAAPKPLHLGFWDLLGHSSGLVAQVKGDAQAATGSTANYNVRMKDCYPYTDTIQYQVGFGDATPSKTLGGATMRGDSGSPQAGVNVAHQWAGAGTYSVSGAPVKDAHGRVFSATPAEFPVTVH